MDPDKSSEQFSLKLSSETRLALLEGTLGRLESEPVQTIAKLRHPRWGREHTVLLAAATCGVATSAVYVLFMLTGISPFDAGELGDDAPIQQSTRQFLAFGEIAFLALIGSWAAWTLVRRG